jgi:D-tyrosyl-tRNA(Tyr) deacylase
MKFVIQRVSKGEVAIDKKVVGGINHGFVVLIGISSTDTIEIADKLIKKLLNLRIFEDENNKANLSISDVNGDLMLISQFTLYANCKKGNRPSFIHAGAPDLANSLYEYIIEECKTLVPHVATGEFGAMMEISLVNEGPFTIILDSDDL